jgi:hypothetical protein
VSAHGPFAVALSTEGRTLLRQADPTEGRGGAGGRRSSAGGSVAGGAVVVDAQDKHPLTIAAHPRPGLLVFHQQPVPARPMLTADLT